MPLFRRAATTSVRRNAIKTLIQIVVFWGFFLFLIPPPLAQWSRRVLGDATLPPSPPLALFLFGCGGLLGLLSARAIVVDGKGTPLPLDGTQCLVTTGPYGFVRNPMAVAGVVQGVAMALWHGSWIVVAFFLTGAVLWHFVVRPVEERDLVATFGAAYEVYRREVPLWAPRLRSHA